MVHNDVNLGPVFVEFSCSPLCVYLFHLLLQLPSNSLKKICLLDQMKLLKLLEIAQRLSVVEDGWMDAPKHRHSVCKKEFQ